MYTESKSSDNEEWTNLDREDLERETYQFQQKRERERCENVELKFFFSRSYISIPKDPNFACSVYFIYLFIFAISFLSHLNINLKKKTKRRNQETSKAGPRPPYRTRSV